MIIEQKIPSLSKDSLNKILETSSEFNEELKIVQLLTIKHQIKAIRLYTNSRLSDIKIAKLLDAVISHLQNLVQTIGKIKSRDLMPKYAIVDVNNKLISK